MKKVKLSDIKTITEIILTKCDVSEEDAEIIADSIIYAHRRGKSTHGIIRLPIYVRKMQKGLMSPQTKITTIKDTPVLSLIDADHGFGQVAGYKGMKLCIDKGKKYGIGMVGIRNSNNFGTAGFLAEMATKKEMIGLVIGNSAPAIAPWGGKLPVLGTNPLGIAFPVGNAKAPIVLDMATSAAARGKIRMAVRNKEKIPFGWAIDSEGKPTNDPAEALKGAMVPIGEHKGYGLALAIDIIAGLLTGSAFGGDVKPLNSPDGFSRFGHMLMVINVNFFMSFEDYGRKMDVLWENIKNSGEKEAVFLPGELSYKKSEDNVYSAELSLDQINEINALAKNLEVDHEL